MPLNKLITKRAFIHGWISPDGKWFPVDSHDEWINKNIDPLKKDYGIDIELHRGSNENLNPVEFLLQKGWIRVAGGGFQMRSGGSLDTLTQFVRENEKELPDVLFIDAPRDHGRFRKQDIIEMGLGNALKLAASDCWCWIDRSGKEYPVTFNSKTGVMIAASLGTYNFNAMLDEGFVALRANCMYDRFSIKSLGLPEEVVIKATPSL